MTVYFILDGHFQGCPKEVFDSSATGDLSGINNMNLSIEQEHHAEEFIG